MNHTSISAVRFLLLFSDRLGTDTADTDDGPSRAVLPQEEKRASFLPSTLVHDNLRSLISQKLTVWYIFPLTNFQKEYAKEWTHVYAIPHPSKHVAFTTNQSINQNQRALSTQGQVSQRRTKGLKQHVCPPRAGDWRTYRSGLSSVQQRDRKMTCSVTQYTPGATMGLTINVLTVHKGTYGLFRKHIMKKKGQTILKDGQAEECHVLFHQMGWWPLLPCSVMGNDSPGWKWNLTLTLKSYARMTILLLFLVESTGGCSQQLIKIGFSELKWKIETWLQKIVAKASHEGERTAGSWAIQISLFPHWIHSHIWGGDICSCPGQPWKPGRCLRRPDLMRLIHDKKEGI